MCVPTLPRIFRPVNRNTHIFFIWPKLASPKATMKPADLDLNCNVKKR